MSEQKRYKILACEILFREICYCVARTPNLIDFTFMPKGLHDMGETKMAELLQAELDKVDITKYDAILLGYALCNNGIRGLHAQLPMVVTRAHDCITLLMGSKEKYDDYFAKNPGTFFKSTGWVERDKGKDFEQGIPSQLGISSTYQQYVEEYGEENAKYFMETIGDWFHNYKKIAYIDTNIGDFKIYKEQTRKLAEENKWEYEDIDGNTSMLQQLIDGEWDSEKFLLVPPGKKILAAYNNTNIIDHD